MKMRQAVGALGPIDARNLIRDPMLRWLVFYPVLMAGLVRWLVPVLRARLLERYLFDLEPYYPLLMSFLLIMSPMMAGMVIGFLLLDQQDDRTLAALRVTPLTLNEYLAYRVTVPMILGVLLTLIVFPLGGILYVSFPALLLAAISAAPLAPFYALALAALAANKVQGFAVAKALGILLVPTVIAYFVRPPGQWLFGLTPLYWPAKLLWQLESGGSFWVYLLVGLIYQGLLLILLLRRFNRAAGRST